MATPKATLSDSLSDTADITSFHNCRVLKDVCILDDRPLGVGAYGKVFEVQHEGKICAAKQIHSLFFSIAREKELKRLKSNFNRECSIWSTLRHPNIVTLIGVYFINGDNSGMPIMVMEKMECTLTSLIESVRGIDFQRKLSILHDVSKGLQYLHDCNPPIIHRDLTPNNILLHQGETKISDLGVSKAMKNTASGCKMTKVPGTPDYMPPETFEDNPRYDTAVDIFSYAGIILFTIIEEWPTPSAREKKSNSENQKREIVLEVDRRQDYLSKMTEYHGERLKSLVISCLNDEPELRPNIKEVSKEIEAFKESPDGFDPVLQVSSKNKNLLIFYS